MQNKPEPPQDLLRTIPDNLPIPQDDGACDHLHNMPLPSINLLSTAGHLTNLAELSGWLILYCYPMTGRPGHSIPEGWIQIPGAAGCTPQACSVRDAYQTIQTLNAKVFGLSTQTSEDQIEAAQRLHLPFELLSDASLEFAQALNLPILEVGDMRLLKRVTLIAKDSIIQKYFYPVFPPDKNIGAALEWLRSKQP